MSLKHLAYIDLPDHVGQGGFDHAAVDRERGLLYVEHIANDALEVIDVRSGKYVRSVGEVTWVAGALVDESQRLVFTSNRGEDTVGIFTAEDEVSLAKIKVGVRPPASPGERPSKEWLEWHLAKRFRG